MRAYTHGDWAHRQRVSTTFFYSEKPHNFFLCFWRGSNLGSLDLESDALPIEPPRHFLSEANYDHMGNGEGGGGVTNPPPPPPLPSPPVTPRVVKTLVSGSRN